MWFRTMVKIQKLFSLSITLQGFFYPFVNVVNYIFSGNNGRFLIINNLAHLGGCTVQFDADKGD